MPAAGPSRATRTFGPSTATRSGAGPRASSSPPRAPRPPRPAGADRLDEAAFQPLADFMANAGLDGLLAMGTTGEGVLLTIEERRRVTELFVAAAAGPLRVIAHCGAQTTRDTTALAEHAARAGADAVVVVRPAR